MSITIEELDNLGFEIVKQKYYNANKVNAKLEELKVSVRELLEENARLKAASVETNAEVSAAGEELVKSARKVADMTIREAEAKAERIVGAAQTEAKRILDEAKAAPAAVAPAAGKLTAAQLDIIDELNRQLDSLNTSQATQIFKLKQQLMNIAIG